MVASYLTSACSGGRAYLAHPFRDMTELTIILVQHRLVILPCNPSGTTGAPREQVLHVVNAVRRIIT